MLSMMKACRVGMKESPVHIDNGRGFLYVMEVYLADQSAVIPTSRPG